MSAVCTGARHHRSPLPPDHLDHRARGQVVDVCVGLAILLRGRRLHMRPLRLMRLLWCRRGAHGRARGGYGGHLRRGTLCSGEPRPPHPLALLLLLPVGCDLLLESGCLGLGSLVRGLAGFQGSTELGELPRELLLSGLLCSLLCQTSLLLRSLRRGQPRKGERMRTGKDEARTIEPWLYFAHKVQC